METSDLKKSIIVNRVLLIILIGMFALVLAGMGFAFYKASIIMQGLKPVYDAVTQIDFTKINDFLEVLDSINSLDIDGITKAIDSVDFEGISELINSIDIEALKKTMESLEKASDMLEQVSEKVAPIIGWFK